jgi:hypothetical protein
MEEKTGFKRFVLLRTVIAIVIIVAFVWALSIGLGYLEQYFGFKDSTASSEITEGESAAALHGGSTTDTPAAQAAHEAESVEDSAAPVSPTHPEPTGDRMSATDQQSPSAMESEHEETPPEAVVHPREESPTQGQPQDMKAPAAAQPADQTHETGTAAAPPVKEAATPAVHAKPLPLGVAFVTAVIEPLEYELNERWWGWRPNDIINVTDNVNNFQLGVLEVTRRAAVQLAERISRTGSTDAFNKHLENAMNRLMIKAEQYWFPTPESKYKESLDEMAIYKEQLIQGAASFYTRTDSIIPLLAAFEDLLGSCDENLVKIKEKDGSKVGYFSTDNYFYYAKGIASAMATILEAVHHDFMDTLEKRNGGELLHHAIESCNRAASLEPWMVTEGDLDGFLANHRANMAAPISHARFFLGQLIKTLST